MCVYISNTTAASITLLFDWDTFDYTATVKSAAYWVICIQQWGLLSTETVNFQIPFDMVFCAFAITKNNVALTDAGATIPALSVSTATMYVNGFNGYWLVVGAKNKQQWGFKAGNNAKWTYPLPLSTLLYVDVSGDVNAPDESANYTKESFVTYADLTHLWFATDNANGDNRFLVIGTVQQWGSCMPGSNQLSIAFIENVYILLALDRTAGTTPDGYYAFAPDRGTLSSVYVVATSNAGQGNYLIAGKQQWGYTIESNGQEDYKYFPISFGSQCYAVSLGSTYNLQSDAYSWIENVDKEKFLIGLGHNYSPMPYPTMFYMAIGEQQWGTYPGNHTLTFAVAFSVPWVLVLNGLTGTAEDRLNTETTLQPNTNVLYNDDPPGGYYIAIGQQQIKRRRYHYRDHTRLFLQIVYRHHKYQWHHY